MNVSNSGKSLLVEVNGKNSYFAYQSIHNIAWTKKSNGDYQVNIDFHGVELSLFITMGSVANQAGWTNTLAGAEQAVIDINSWMASALGSVSISAPIGNNTQSASLSVTLATDETGQSRTPGIIRPTGSGNVSSVAAVFYSVSVANVGAADGTVLGSTIKKGEVLNFSADAINNYFTSFAYDATGTEFIITFIY